MRKRREAESGGNDNWPWSTRLCRWWAQARDSVVVAGYASECRDRAQHTYFRQVDAAKRFAVVTKAGNVAWQPNGVQPGQLIGAVPSSIAPTFKSSPWTLIGLGYNEQAAPPIASATGPNFASLGGVNINYQQRKITTNTARVQLNTPGITYSEIYPGTYLCNRWVEIALSWDTTNVRFYADGNLVQTTAWTPSTVADVTTINIGNGSVVPSTFFIAGSAAFGAQLDATTIARYGQVMRRFATA